jgi:outer membrane protein OmpA-like peptidoglycan-associated protein
VRVPGFTIDSVVVNGERVADAIVRPPLIVPEVAVPAVRVEQNCTIKETADGRLALVRRRLVRPAAVRRESVRPGAHRDPVCVDDECSAEVNVDEVVVPQAGLAEIVIPERTVILGRIPDTPQTLAVDTEVGRSYFAPVDLLFAVDSAQLGPDATPVLEAIAAELNAAAPGSRITVEGHTDSDGERAYNDDLSRRRADAVKDWLVGVGGVSADRITTTGFGEDVPVASNETAEGRALNRRVVISVEA